MTPTAPLRCRGEACLARPAAGTADANSAGARPGLRTEKHESYAPRIRGSRPGRTAIDHFHEHHARDEIVKDAAEGYTLVLEADGSIVGTGSLVGTSISRMYVAPKHQGKGLGGQILEALEARARAGGVETVGLAASIPARRFYERNGYRLLAEGAHEFPDGGRLDWFEMAKTLQADQE